MIPREQNIQQNRMQDQVNVDLFKKYRIESEIGRGASGVCYRVQNVETMEVYCMKKIHISSIRKNSAKQAANQVSILSKIDHPNIVKYYQSFWDDSSLYIIMQYAAKGDLHSILKKRHLRKQHYSEVELWQMCRQMLSALEYLHRNHIIHRDVKTLNIFVDAQGVLKLGDLGASRIVKTDIGLYSRVGTPLYLPPEIIKHEKYDYTADVWGLGCVAYLMATLTHPFEGKNIISLGQNIVFAIPKPIENYSESLSKLIMKMLDKNPRSRPLPFQLLKEYFQKPKRHQNELLSALAITSESKLGAKEKDASLVIKGIASQSFVTDQSIVSTKLDKGMAQIKLYNKIRRKKTNNYMLPVKNYIVFEKDSRLLCDESVDKWVKDCVKEKSFEDTIVLVNKGQEDKSKKNVEETHKRQDKNEQSVKNASFCLKMIHMQGSSPAYRKAAGKMFSSDKKLEEVVAAEQYKSQPRGEMANEPDNVQQVKPIKQRQTNYRRTEPCQKSQQIPTPTPSTRLNTDSMKMGSSERNVRVRPKSSIMNKDMREIKMHMLKKMSKREGSHNLNSDIQMKILFKPEIIII